ncbi:hypothetical protein RclHR1_00960020 [Rhizophagus clarus]|uniref:BTB/POZ protein n=1 Tax=Rhizophagus clarus TaxID=94130 RepID=A0A2Z6SAW6_9GLOM|nr:hypothetical protein RclHR1_00960020 [Rhizophagus clarus]GES83232.1 BTB/POZ protein [Rhizophagus clarus]
MYYTDLIAEDPVKIFNSLSNFIIPKKLFELDNSKRYLQMNEIQVWERVLKWEHARNPELPSVITNYSKHDLMF